MKVKKAKMAANVKRARKSPTTTELPDELIREEILIRIPIKSVVRFKSVCKSWLSLFSSSQFVKEYNTRIATETPERNDCLIAEKDNRIIILSRYKETFVLPTDICCELVGSINGLICLRRRQKLSLWNPAIHQSKEFTLPPHHSIDLERIGLGYDPASNDYKVVIVGKWFACVYSYISDYWTDIFVPEHLIYRLSLCHSSSPNTIVKNCPYWKIFSYTFDKQFIYVDAVKFDAGSNELKLVPGFHFDVINGRGPNFVFVNLNDCLTLMVYRPVHLNMLVDVYSLDEKRSGSWTKMYSVGPLGYHKEIWCLSQGFKHGSEIVCHVYGKFICFDHQTNTIKRIRGSSGSPFVSCYTYTPSLVFLQGMRSVYLQTQTRTHGLSSKIPRRLVNSLRD